MKAPFSSSWTILSNGAIIWPTGHFSAENKPERLRCRGWHVYIGVVLNNVVVYISGV